MPKKVTTEHLAQMMAKGFEDIQGGMASKEDLSREIGDVRQDLEEIKLKFDHVAHKFEIKDLEKRVKVLEEKIEAK